MYVRIVRPERDGRTSSCADRQVWGLLQPSHGLRSRLGLLAANLEYGQLRTIQGQRALVFQKPARGEGLYDGDLEANLSQTISVTLSLIHRARRKVQLHVASKQLDRSPIQRCHEEQAMPRTISPPWPTRSA